MDCSIDNDHKNNYANDENRRRPLIYKCHVKNDKETLRPNDVLFGVYFINGSNVEIIHVQYKEFSIRVNEKLNHDQLKIVYKKLAENHTALEDYFGEDSYLGEIVCFTYSNPEKAQIVDEKYISYYIRRLFWNMP